jgi:RNA polymerase sigma factor (sigma-70 family)
MSGKKRDFATLIQEMREGSQTATHELITNYGEHILRVVRRKLHKSLRPRFDSDDFVQAVWASFFAVLPEHTTFAGPEELLAFLAEMAQNKVVEAIRQRLIYQKNNLSREQPLEQVHLALCAKQPTPVEVAIAREEWQKLFDRQPAHYQRMLLMLGGGDGRREVARTMGVHERTIHRIIEKLSPRQTDEPK